MAEAKVVRGTLGGVAVTASEETVALLGTAFEPEKKAAASKSSSSKSSK